MVGLDDDADKATRTSSSTTLELPEGATVTWAGLYWSANVPAGASSDSPRAHLAVRRRARRRTPRSSPTGSTPVSAPDAGRPTRRSPTSRPRSPPAAPARGGPLTPSPSRDRPATPAGPWSSSTATTRCPIGRVSVVDGFTSVAPGTDVELTLPGTAGSQRAGRPGRLGGRRRHRRRHPPPGRRRAHPGPRRRRPRTTSRTPRRWAHGSSTPSAWMPSR